jgi:hypothetical protein
MTRTTSARIAGFSFLFYIAVGITQIFVGSGATSGDDTAAKLRSVATHAAGMRVNLVLTLVISVTALTLAVALYGITRDEDREIAVLALVCRAIEGGVIPVLSMLATLGLLSLGSAAVANAPDGAMATVLAAYLLNVRGWNALIAATFFAVGSTLFSWLFLRGRMIPVPLAWLGLVASVLLVVGLPLQLTGFLRGPATQLMWIPMAAFEVPLGLWLLTKGVAVDRVRS